MELLNEMSAAKDQGLFGTEVWKEAVDSYLKLLAPVSPHIAEEIWQKLGNMESIHLAHWPVWDETALVVDSITLAVQINGKVRDRITVSTSASEEQIKSTALKLSSHWSDS